MVLWPEHLRDSISGDLRLTKRVPIRLLGTSRRSQSTTADGALMTAAAISLQVPELVAHIVGISRRFTSWALAVSSPVFRAARDADARRRR
jgi:hypothetical protein